MSAKILPDSNTLYTPGSETTVKLNYSPACHILEVEFTGGRTYHYKDVPPSVWQSYKEVVETGGSSGSFVNQHIKQTFHFEEVWGTGRRRQAKKKTK